MSEKLYILIGLGLIFLIIALVLMLARFIYWKNVKLEKIAELRTTVGLKDYKIMRSLVGVPGVWAQYVGKECWNVCKTNNMGQEMMTDSRRCQNGLNNALKNNSRIREDYTYQASVAIRYRDLIKYAVAKRKKIRFVIIMTLESKNDDLLEFEEMKYAIQHKAIAWNPAPGKQNKIYWEWKNGGGNIEKFRRKYIN